jgi:hypothetical protein
VIRLGLSFIMVRGDGIKRVIVSRVDGLIDRGEKSYIC